MAKMDDCTAKLLLQGLQDLMDAGKIKFEPKMDWGYHMLDDSDLDYPEHTGQIRTCDIGGHCRIK